MVWQIVDQLKVTFWLHDKAFPLLIKALESLPKWMVSHWINDECFFYDWVWPMDTSFTHSSTHTFYLRLLPLDTWKCKLNKFWHKKWSTPLWEILCSKLWNFIGPITFKVFLWKVLVGALPYYLKLSILLGIHFGVSSYLKSMLNNYLISLGNVGIWDKFGWSHLLLWEKCWGVLFLKLIIFWACFHSRIK